MAPLKLEVENLLVVSLVTFIYYIFYILRTVSLFFLVHQAKRTINTNDHVCDWRRETGKALVSRSCAARHSRAQALPSLNLNKKRDCSQSIVLQTVSAKVKEITLQEMLATQGKIKQNYKIMMWNEAKLSSWSLVKFLVKKKMTTVKFL